MRITKKAINRLKEDLERIYPNTNFIVDRMKGQTFIQWKGEPTESSVCFDIELCYREFLPVHYCRLQIN